MRSIICVFFLFILVSCDGNKESMQDSNKKDLILSIVEEFSLPIPPPPDFENIEISDEVIDSLKSVRMDIAIHPILFKPNLNTHIVLDKFEKPFKDLFNKFQNLNSAKVDNIERINNESRHFVVLADTIILKQSKDWKEYDLVYNISSISFNEEFDKAVCLIGISRSALWGHGGVYFFKKKKGQWKNIDKIIFEKS